MSFGDLCLRVGHLSRSQSEEVVRAAKHLGYSYVALDIQISGNIVEIAPCTVEVMDHIRKDYHRHGVQHLYL